MNRTLIPARDQRTARLFRRIAAMGISGVVAGLLVAGIGGRLLMRIAALAADDGVVGRLTENGNRVGEITLDGTFGLLVFVGLFFGGVGAVVHVISEPWLRWAGRWRGPALGLLLLAVGSTAVLNPRNFDFALVGKQGLTVLMFIALFLLYGIVTVWLSDRLDSKLPQPGSRAGSTVVVLSVILVALGAPFLIGLGGALFSADFCRCDRAPWPTGLFVVGMGAATAASWFSEAGPRSLRSMSVGRVGLVSLAGALVAGLGRAAADILAIL